MDWAVIGSNSFYGSNFVCLLEDQHQNVLHIRRPEHDLNRTQDILDALHAARPSYVVNFAALNVVAPSWEHWEDYYRTNVLGVARLAQGLVGAKWLRRFVQVSTPEVYGNTNTRLKPGAAFNPSTPYAISRAAADLHLKALHREREFPVIFPRTVNIYGPGQQPYRIIPRTALCAALGGRVQLEGGGRTERSFIHVRDAAAAVQRAATLGVSGQTYHISSSEMTQIRDLVGMVLDIAEARWEDVVEEVPERPGKDNAYLLDDGETRRELKWKDHTPLDLGLRETVLWFKEHAEDYRGKHLDYVHRA